MRNHRLQNQMDTDVESDQEKSTPTTLTRPLSTAITRLPADQAKNISFYNLTYSVPIKEKRSRFGSRTVQKVILDSITGQFRSGRFTVILGSSGAGKTSLLNLLAGKARMGTQTGTIAINGQEASGRDVADISGFVYQEDITMDTQTVKEAVEMSALLRMDRDMPNTKKLVKAREVIKMMNLTKCADTYLGSALIKGVSGGEKKRACIAMELITNPSVIFLDEPTSGLDSYNAYSVCRTLKSLAESGRTIVATLHQPSSEIFHLIDDLILMAEGRILYCGTADASVEYFARCGYPCPTFSNPSDFFFFQLLGDEEEEDSQQSVIADRKFRLTHDNNAEESSAEKTNTISTHDSFVVGGTSKKTTAVSRTDKLLNAWIESPEGKKLSRQIRVVTARASRLYDGRYGYDPSTAIARERENDGRIRVQASFFFQLRILFLRAWRNAVCILSIFC